MQLNEKVVWMKNAADLLIGDHNSLRWPMHISRSFLSNPLLVVSFVNNQTFFWSKVWFDWKLKHLKKLALVLMGAMIFMFWFKGPLILLLSTVNVNYLLWLMNKKHMLLLTNSIIFHVFLLIVMSISRHNVRIRIIEKCKKSTKSLPGSHAMITLPCYFCWCYLILEFRLRLLFQQSIYSLRV